MKRPKRVRKTEDKYVVARKKKTIYGKYLFIEKRLYWDRWRKRLCYSAASVDQIRFFDDRESAADFIDKCWMKYPNDVKGRKVYKADKVLK